MICPNCKRELPDDTKFCGGCGTRMLPPETPIVQQPVQFTETVFEQPVQFTEPVFEEPVNVNEPVYTDIPVADQNKPEAKERNKGKFSLKNIPAKYLKLGGIVAAVLVVAIVALCVFAGGSGSAAGNGSGFPEGALYLKDGELYYSDYSKKGPQEVTSNLLDNASSSKLRDYASQISYTIHVTEDGKTMFYMDKMSTNGEGTLYWRSLTNFKEDAVKISSGIKRYTVSKDGKTVTYLKGETLCQYNMKEEEKLEKNVASYRVSEDGKTIYFKNTEGTWYVLKAGEKEKIGNDITIEYITEDYSTIYYMSGDKLYRKTIGKDKEKLMSKLEEITDIGEDGTFYYMTLEEVDLLDFFTKDTEEYSGLEEELAGNTLEFYTIGYYDGKKEVELFETCGEVDMENGIMLCYQYDLSQVPAIPYTKLIAFYSESSHYYLEDAAEAMVQTSLEEVGTLYIAINGKTSRLELEQIDDLVISDDNSVIYALCEMDYEKDEGVLYKITISGEKVKSTEVLDEDVSAQRGGYFARYSGGQSTYFVYYKDLKDDVGDLYANGTLVDSDVYARKSVVATADGKGLIYFVDYNTNKDEGVLKTWNGKEATEIFDGAYAYSVMENGNILVGSDYNDDDDTFCLSVWNGKEVTEISDEACDVTELSNGDLLVSTDYSEKHRSYTLSLWNGRALSVISEDVYDYTILPDDEVLFLYDYSTSKYEGELHHWNGKKSVMVDEDVAAVIELPGAVTHYFRG